MLIELVEYGKGVRYGKTDLPLENIRKESVRWKQILGLRELPISVEYAGPDAYTLRAQGVAGALQIGDCSVEVRPKFLDAASSAPWKRALFHILAIIDSLLPSVSGPSLGATAEASFPDFIGSVLSSSMSLAQAEGYVRGYTETEGLLPVLRGRLDANKFGTFLFSPHQIPCIYDEYGEDIPLNRLLRWAAIQLASQVRSGQLSQRLTEAANFLGDVSGLPPGLMEAEGLTLPVQFGYLQPALDAARILLRQQALHYQTGDLEGTSFLWKSFDVFERFIRRLLSVVSSSVSGWELDKPALTLASPREGTAGSLLTIPDYRLRRSGRVAAILDAKYKTWPKGSTPDVSNVYQVMASGRLQECPHVCLIYPKSSNAPDRPKTWKLRGGGNPVFVHAIFVDLMAMASTFGEKELVGKLDADLRQVLNVR